MIRRLSGAGALALMLAAAAVATWPLLRPPDGRLRLTVLDVGQGDAIVVEAPDGRALLIDAGPGGPMRLDTGERVVAPYLWNRGHLRLSKTIVTDPDADHAGGMGAIRRLFGVAEPWDVEQLARGPHWFGGVMLSLVWPRVDQVRGWRAPSETRSFWGLSGETCMTCPSADRLPAWSRRGPATPSPGLVRDAADQGPEPLRDPLLLGVAGRNAPSTSAPDPVASVVEEGPRPPARHAARGRNDETLVLRIEYGLASFLLASDIEAGAEQALVASRVPLGATVLKVAHHGSRTSSTPELLRAVAPTVAVISVGARNPYGHPDTGVLGRLAAAVARVYRTDRDGAVIFESDGRELTVTRWVTRSVERFCLDPETPC